MILMNNLDRFSRPLDSERVRLFHLLPAIEEQNELNKKHMVMDYVSQQWSNYLLVPTVEEIQEHFYKMDLDSDMVNKIISEF